MRPTTSPNKEISTRTAHTTAMPPSTSLTSSTTLLISIKLPVMAMAPLMAMANSEAATPMSLKYRVSLRLVLRSLRSHKKPKFS